MSSKKKNIYIYLGKVILITLLIVLIVRTFFISSFTISSPQMEVTLYDGDKILIDKTAYGIRLPITILSIPFAFDNIGGIQSYSSIWQLPYKRISPKSVNKNDIVLFNNPLETDKPLDKRSLIISRCAALPEDTIEMKKGLLFISGKQYEGSPNMLKQYKTILSDGEELKFILSELDIPERDITQDSIYIRLKISKYEAFLLRGAIADSLSVVNAIDTTQNYSFIVPSKGYKIRLNEENLIVYKQVIEQEQQGKEITITNGVLRINGIEHNYYTFDDDYYWMLSDNTDSTTDSRSLGFVPFHNVIGKAFYVWDSNNKNQRFSPIE